MSDAPVFLFLSFEHPNNAVDTVAEAMALGLRAHGVDAAVCTLPRDLPKLAQLPPERVAGLMSLGSLPLTARIGGRLLWEHFPVPVSLFLLDALPYDLARVPGMATFLEAALQNPRLSLVSPEDGYRRWLGEALPVRWTHLPFGAFPAVQPGRVVEPPQARVCVIGTVGSELGGSPVGETLDALLQRVLGGAAPARRARLAEALTAPDAAAMPALTVCRELGWSPADALHSQRLPVLIAIDSWVKRERRLAAVRSLAGIPCDFFGRGWAELLGEVPGFRHVGQVHHGDIARLVPHYMAVLNFDPNWSHGVHDRVYTATAMGTRVLTNTNEALAGAALPGDLVATYDANRPALAQTLLDAGWLDALPAPARPRAELLAGHGWAARMAGWLCDMPADSAAPAPRDTAPTALRTAPSPAAASATPRAASPAPAHPLIASLAL